MRRPSGIMAPITSRRMLDELWRLVFEELLEQTPSPATIFPLLCVCKAWKACSQSLLYRHLSFSNVETLKDFYTHLFLQANDSRYPGLYTQTLTLLPGSGVQYVISDKVPRILGYVHNLRGFHAPDVDICSTILEPLLVVAKITLRELSLTLCSSESDGAINLSIVSRFTNLTSLRITVNWGADSPIFSIGKAPGMKMHALHSLYLSSPRVAPVPEFVEYFQRCDLPGLANLELNFPYLTSHGTSLLQPALKRFGASLECLSYTAPDAACLPHAALRLLPNLQQLHAKTIAPLTDVIATLPSSVEEINLPLDLTLTESTTRVVEFLDGLLVGSPEESALRRVRLTMPTPNRFDWCTIPRLAPVLAGQLMSMAIQLGGRNVRLLDGSDNTLIMVASRELTRNW